jgi:tetratricopeptide (TPR) repeat protein
VAEDRRHFALTLGHQSLMMLYRSQGKLTEAEKMYIRALQGQEEALGPKHTSTLITVSGLGNLYRDQGNIDEAEKMYMDALQGFEEALGPKSVMNYRLALITMGNLYNLKPKESTPRQRHVIP